MTIIERAFLTITIPLLALIPIGCAYLDFRQRQLIFSPIKSEPKSEPASAPFQERWIALDAPNRTEASGLHAWWAPAHAPDAPAVLFLHGAAGNLGGNADRIAQWQRMGFSVLAIDYRGYGKSPGKLPTEHSVYEDAQVAWNYLKQLQPDACKRFVYGHSLGGAIAIELAQRTQDMAGLIVESTFTSIRDMVKTFMFGWAATGRVITQNFDSLAKVAKLAVPVLFMHGAQDEVVPHSMSERLYAQASGPKQLVLFDRSHHSDIPDTAFEQYRCAVREFAGKVIG
jgi:uncharacterized protein